MLLLAGILTFNYFRPIPAVAATPAVATSTTLPGSAADLPWPKVGSAAIGVSDLIRNPQGKAAKRIAKVGEENICTSIIVAAELRYGCAKRGSERPN